MNAMWVYKLDLLDLAGGFRETIETNSLRGPSQLQGYRSDCRHDRNQRNFRVMHGSMIVFLVSRANLDQEPMRDSVELGANVKNLRGRRTLNFTILTGKSCQAA